MPRVLPTRQESTAMDADAGKAYKMTELIEISVEDVRIEKFGSIPSTHGHLLVLLRTKRVGWKKYHKMVVAFPLKGSTPIDEKGKQFFVDISIKKARETLAKQESEPE